MLTFIPMNASRFIVLVALGGDHPDLSTLAAFVAGGASWWVQLAGPHKEGRDGRRDSRTGPFRTDD